MRLFTKIDETFKLAREICDLIIVVSDHGFSKYKYGVYVNTFFEQLGLTKRVSRRTMKDIVCHRQVDRPKMQIQLPENLYTCLAKLPSLIEFLLLKIYRQMLKANIRARLTTHIDPKFSNAFAHGFGIYVKEKELIDYVRLMLMKERFIGGVWKKEELYSGKHVKDMPDLIVIPNFNAGFSFRGDVIAPKVVTRRDFSSHHPNGIVIIYTKGIKPSWTEKIKIYDIAPTLLDYLGLDKPEDMDGNVINLS
jgi:predicted AlkP superfamily phosphohydrolase/phosphomutase